jgi:hypothetical protein
MYDGEGSNKKVGILKGVRFELKRPLHRLGTGSSSRR